MKRIIGIVFFLLTVVFFSCQNDKIDTVQEEGLSEKAAQLTLTEVQLEALSTESEYEVEFYANAERFLSRWLRMGRMWQGKGNLRYWGNHCPDVAIDENGDDVYPKTITLDYGDSTLLRNGKILSGIIIIEISAPRDSANYTRTVTYDGFGIDSLVVNGLSTVTVDKLDEMLRQVKSEFTITLADGSFVSRSSERTWQWIEGFETEDDPSDDVIEIAGFVNAEFNGDIYTKEIITPLKRIADCRFIVEGIVTITLNEELLCSIDYGDGTCDEVATVTKDGETYEIDLPNHKMKGDKNQKDMQNNKQKG